MTNQVKINDLVYYVYGDGKPNDLKFLIGQARLLEVVLKKSDHYKVVVGFRLDAHVSLRSEIFSNIKAAEVLRASCEESYKRKKTKN